jgi:cell division protein FtsB
METYNPEKLMADASNSESGISDEEKQLEQLNKKEKELSDTIKKLGNICYAINSFEGIDENLIGRYGLDALADKCRFLAELIKNDSSPFVEKSSDLQHYIGNFEGGLALLTHVSSSTEKEKSMGASLQKKIGEFDSYLTAQIQEGHRKETAIH